MVFWLTIAGANVPSAMLAALLIDTRATRLLKGSAAALGLPWWLDGFLVDGMYLATAWVVSVMLPPMAIFFPLFTLLEDFGYLPRVAFNLDRMFQRVGRARQAGADDVHGVRLQRGGRGGDAHHRLPARAADRHHHEQLLALQRALAHADPDRHASSSGALAPAHLAGLVGRRRRGGRGAAGRVLHVRGLVGCSPARCCGARPPTFSLELPPYRPPRVLQTLYTSLIDRTIIVLWRAVVFALPAGRRHLADRERPSRRRQPRGAPRRVAEPGGRPVGLNGVILLAYIVAIPANEIVIPTVLMLTVLAHRR